MEEDPHSYVSLFGQRVNLQAVNGHNYEKDIPSFKRLSLKEASDEAVRPGHNSPSTITSLPTEVLMIIFKLLSNTPQKHWSAEHFSHQRRTTRSSAMESVPVQCDCKELWLRPAFHWRSFPYAQARVCTRWRAVLSSSPALWTKIVVSRVSGDWTHPRELEDYLCWTKDLPIEVYIGKERNQRAALSGFGPDTISESDMIAQYTAILKPHLHRCTVIDYHLQYSTSLPSVLYDLSGISESLESLKLICDEEYPPFTFLKVPETRPLIAPGTISLPRRFPNLATLALDGANFILAAIHLPELIRYVRDELKIHHYHRDLNLHPHVDELDFTALQVLMSLFPRLSIDPGPHQLLITFQSVEFIPLQHTRYVGKNIHDSYRSYPELTPIDNDDIDWTHIWLKCTDMSDRLLSELTILGGASGISIPQCVELENCTIRPLDSIPALINAGKVQLPSSPTDLDGYFHIPEFTFETIPFPSPRIGLRNIQDPESIKNFLDRITGGQLSIHSCDGLTDDVLLRLQDSVIDVHHYQLYGDWFMLGIGDIEISECPNFSPDCLWSFLSSKNGVIKDLDIEDDDKIMHQNDIWVQHPRLKLDASTSSKWEKRFREVCDRFTWNYVPRDNFTSNDDEDDSDEEMHDAATQDSFSDTEIFEPLTELDLISPEISPFYDEILLEAAWPPTPELDSVKHASWVARNDAGINRAVGAARSSLEEQEKLRDRFLATATPDDKRRLDTFLTAGAFRAVPDDFLILRVPQASTSGEIGQTCNEFVDADHLQSSWESGDADSMDNT